MKAKEFIQQLPIGDVTFVIKKAVKDANSPFYHDEYETTSMCKTWEFTRETWLDRYIVVNPDHPPVDVTGHWVNAWKRGFLRCMMITTEEDLARHYKKPGDQYERMLEWYDKIAKGYLKNMK